MFSRWKKKSTELEIPYNEIIQISEEKSYFEYKQIIGAIKNGCNLDKVSNEFVDNTNIVKNFITEIEYLKYINPKLTKIDSEKLLETMLNHIINKDIKQQLPEILNI